MPGWSPLGGSLPAPPFRDGEGYFQPGLLPHSTRLLRVVLGLPTPPPSILQTPNKQGLYLEKLQGPL